MAFEAGDLYTSNADGTSHGGFEPKINVAQAVPKAEFDALQAKLEAARTGTHEAVEMAKESFDELQATFNEVLAQKEALEKEVAKAKYLVANVIIGFEKVDGTSFYADWRKEAKGFLEAPHEAK